MDTTDRRDFYTDERDRYVELLGSVTRRLNILALARLLIFVAGITGSVFLFRINTTAGLLFIIFVITAFLQLVRRYTRLSWYKDYYSNLVTINANEIKCLQGDYSSFDPGIRYIDHEHDFSHDMDIFGKKSLFQYIDRTCSDTGSSVLAGWLGDPYSLSPLFRVRSEAIRELSGMTEWRQRFSATGMMNPLSPEDKKRMTRWLSEEPVFRNSRTIGLLALILPSITVILMITAISGIIGFSPFILSFLINLLILSLGLKKINRVHSLVSRQYGSLNTLSGLLEHFGKTEFASGYLGDLQAQLAGGKIKALGEIGRLATIIRYFDMRLNMVAGVMLNGIFLWDYHSVLKLEKWKRDVKELVPLWFETLGVVDGLISVANFAFNNPGYAYPEMVVDGEFFSATGMGHPLIMSDRRVPNDFSIDRKGVINIVTGANMAGKSTFLRTVAVNMVLGMIGSPVCAEKLRFTPVKIFSSMRTSDSLSDNESYFFAELKRLKRLKEKIDNNEPLFFILDEILKGTNSRDKSEGSRLFIEKIAKKGATGIIATHDVSLGELEKSNPGSIRNNCFEIIISGDSISFDYLLREGITTRMNAAILMKQQGII